MKYKFIRHQKVVFTVGKMCRNLGISKSGYYDWYHRAPSKRSLIKEKLKNRLKDLFYETHNEMAGSPLLTEDLNEDSEFTTVYRSRIAALMKDMGLRCKIQKIFTVTTDSKHKEWIAANLLERNFSPAAPGMAIVGDITYLRVASRWIYLSLFIDLYDRKVIGWDLSASLDTDSTCRALKQSLAALGQRKGILVHSDQGIQYASKQFRNILKSSRAVQSMSRKGNCWDNAVAESFFHTLKTRLIYHRKYKTKEEFYSGI